MAKKYKHSKKVDLTPYMEFSAEMDLLFMPVSFSERIEDYRYRLLDKINPKLIKFCRKLKSHNVDFHIIYPIEIDRNSLIQKLA